ncbi:pyridoxal kinase PdxY [Luteococcus sp. Sow4_B9]|uniref:pyridoxal kinase PdxY n=1 Tax=Luteococcus sp. Sow4_B9 TaxID=3438792 RepID=UPI003F9B1753
MTTILSIQSAVAYGHAGNSAAVFPLQRLGVEVWPVLTVTFSNHTGYGAWRGPLVAADDVREVVLGIEDRQVLDQADALLTGYQGSADMGAVILEAAELVKRRNPNAIYCCDPVMGDVGRGFYCLPGIPEFMRDEVLPRADVITPNLFELEFLTGRQTHSVADVVASARGVIERGPSTVLVTSVTGEGEAPDVVRMVAVTDDGAWQVETPMIERTFTGSGDLTTAMFLAHLLESGSAQQALGATASIVYSVLRTTADLERKELALIQAQANVNNPEYVFTASRID